MSSIVHEEGIEWEVMQYECWLCRRECVGELGCCWVLFGGPDALFRLDHVAKDCFGGIRAVACDQAGCKAGPQVVCAPFNSGIPCSFDRVSCAGVLICDQGGDTGQVICPSVHGVTCCWGGVCDGDHCYGRECYNRRGRPGRGCRRHRSQVMHQVGCGCRFWRGDINLPEACSVLLAVAGEHRFASYVMDKELVLGCSGSLV